MSEPEALQPFAAGRLSSSLALCARCELLNRGYKVTHLVTKLQHEFAAD